MIDFDSEKSNKNIHDRGLCFSSASEFDWVYIEDDRKLYPERRYIAMGYLNSRLHVLCFSSNRGEVRIISFRNANKRVVKKYEKETINK